MNKLLFLIVVLLSLVCSFSHKEVTWVAIGDSITYLNNHQNETGNRITKGYMTMVTQKLPYIHYMNQGHNGWTSRNIADSIEQLGLQKADVYSIFLGTNDWWQGRPVGSLTDFEQNTGTATVYGSFRRIIDKIRSLNPTAKIILITPLQRADFVYINDPRNNAYGAYRNKKDQMLSEFADAIVTIGKEEHLKVVDLYNKSGIRMKNLVKFKRLKNPQSGIYQNYTFPSYIDIPFNPEADDYPYPVEAMDMTYDGLHPSEKGYGAITKMLVKVLRKY